MAMVSDLGSGQLAAQLGLRGRSFPAFTDGNVTDAENDADSADSTFGSRQPPDARSDALRKKSTSGHCERSARRPAGRAFSCDPECQ
jgi:hypothetical protein